VTAQHFLTYRDEQTSAADGTYWVPRIPRPILILRDEADGVVMPFEPYMLLSAAQAEGSLVPSIQYVLLPNRRPPSREVTSSQTMQRRWSTRCRVGSLSRSCDIPPREAIFSEKPKLCEPTLGAAEDPAVIAGRHDWVWSTKRKGVTWSWKDKSP
jgi:hypothetical protein